MALSSIDVGAAREVVRLLRAFVEDAGQEWREVGAAADDAPCDSSALRGLLHPLMTIGELATQLEQRVELAVLIDSAGVAALGTTSADGRVSFEVGDDEPIADVRSRIAGLRLAADLKRLADAAAEGEDVDADEVARCTELLETHAADQAALDALFSSLGARGVFRVPLALPALFTRRYDVDGTPSALSTEEAAAVRAQERLITAFGHALATTSASHTFRTANPSFASELVTAATAPGIGHARALSEVLRHGAYAPDFLVDLGEGLLGWERERDSLSVWPQRGITGQTKPRQPGVVYVDTQYNDPLTGVFDAMGRTPRAALDFLNPDAGGPVAQDRLRHLLAERAVGDQFGRALAAAATSFRGSGGPIAEAGELERARATQSAWIASASVHYLATSSRGTPDALKDDVGRVLATYMYDVDRIANGGQGTALGVIEPAYARPWEEGLRTGASFDLIELRTVLGAVQTDESARGSLTLGAAFLNATRMQEAARNLGPDGVDPDGALHGAANSSSRLNGFLLGTANRALTTAAKESDESVEQFMSIASGVAGLLPAGETITSFVAEQGREFVTEKATGSLGGKSEETEQLLDRLRQSALSDLTVTVGAAVAASGAYPAGGEISGRTQSPHPWFEDGTYDPAPLSTSLVRDDFIGWTTGPQSGHLTTELLPDVAAMFADGEKRGMGG